MGKVRGKAIYELNNLPESEKLSENERKDIFMKAIEGSVQEIVVYNNIYKQMTGK